MSERESKPGSTRATGAPGTGATTSADSFGARDVFDTGSGRAYYYRLAKLQEDGLGRIDRLPFSIKVLLEALLRNEDGHLVTADDVRRLAG